MVTQDGTVPSVASWFVTLCLCASLWACAHVCLCACGVCTPYACTQSFPALYTHTHRLCRSNSPVPNQFWVQHQTGAGLGLPSHACCHSYVFINVAFRSVTLRRRRAWSNPLIRYSSCVYFPLCFLWGLFVVVFF